MNDDTLMYKAIRNQSRGLHGNKILIMSYCRTLVPAKLFGRTYVTAVLTK